MDRQRKENASDSASRALLPIVMPAIVPWVTGLALGILIESRCPIAGVVSVAIIAAAGALLLVPPLRLRFGIVLALTAGVGLGAFVHHRAFREIPSDHISLYCATDRSLARITGRVANEPKLDRLGYAPFERWIFDRERTTFILDAEQVETVDGPQPVSGLVHVRVKAFVDTLRQSDRVEAFGWLRRLKPPQNPGQYDWAQAGARRGVLVSLDCNQAASLQLLDQSDPRPGIIQRLRDHVRAALLDDQLLDNSDAASLLDALILGRREGIERDMEEVFVRTGCAHYLAVSGFHVGIVACFVWFATRVTGFGRRLQAIVVMLVVVLYAVIADPRPPILRATIMAVAILLSLMGRRRPSLLGSLSLAAFIILLVNPTALFDVGFQLSFTAVAAVVYLRPAVAALVPFSGGRRARPDTIDAVAEAVGDQKSLGRRVANWFAVLVSVSLAAWLASLPIVAVTFGRVAPWGWIDSVIAFFAVIPVMFFGFIKLLLGLVLPPLAPVANVPLAAFASCLLWVMDLLGRVPGTIVQVPAPPIWLAVIYYAALVAIVAWRFGRLRGRVVHVYVGALAVGTALWLLLPAYPPGVRVTQLAVGRGTSTVIEMPDGRVWIYDAGASGSIDPGAKIVVPYLRHRGIRRVDGIILSHANLDHFGGALSIVDAVRCGPVYLSPYFASHSDFSGPAGVLLAELMRRGHPVETIHAGSALDMGPSTDAEILWPAAESHAGLSVNDSSLVIRLTTDHGAILLTGDIGDIPQQWLIANEEVSADVLVLPHHGAVTSSTASFVNAVRPDRLVRSSFVRTAESPELARLAGDLPIFNTVDSGAVEIMLGPGPIQIRGYAD